MPVYFNGLILGLSLIMALGPQNVFLIRQGARRNHAFLTAFVCLLCDTLLIAASIIGLHQMIEQHPLVKQIMIWAGSLFLLFYGYKAISAAFSVQQARENSPVGSLSRFEIIALSMGFSLFNPQAIIDSLVIIGSGSAQFPHHELSFMAGVMTSSMIWFFSISALTYFSANLLSRASVWQKIELGSGVLMVFLGIKLLMS